MSGIAASIEAVINRARAETGGTDDSNAAAPSTAADTADSQDSSSSSSSSSSDSSEWFPEMCAEDG